MPVSRPTPRRTLSVCLTLLLTFAGSCRAQSGKEVTLFPFDRPFLFGYGTWEKRAAVENGKVILRGEGLTPKGGAGVNVLPPNDLSKYADFSPTLKVKTGAGNTLGKLRLLLADADGGVSFYDFALLKTAGEAWVLPDNGASLTRPNSADKKGKADVSKVMQWQLSGDWSGDTAVDVEVVSLSVTPATPALLAQRTALDKADADEKAAKDKANAERRAKYGKRTANSPQIIRVYAAAPDVLAIEIQAKRLIPGKLAKYAPLPGDAKREVKNGKGIVTQVILVRGGEEIGWLIGDKRDTLVTYEQLAGDPLLDDAAEAPANFTLFGPTLNARPDAMKPAAVYRKSKPTDWRMPMYWRQPDIAFSTRHTIYLKLPKPLTSGKKYTLDVGALNVQQAKYDFTFTPDSLWTESVHVNQIGFRPDDAPKRAFLSVWLGTGGAQTFPDNLTFHVVNVADGRTAFTGRVERVLAADGADKLWQGREKNYASTAVYRMDFSALTAPGTYRVAVEGVGCSYPFPISRDAWGRAFRTQMRGFLNERSGVPLGPPLTAFVKPIDLRVGYGAKVMQSSYSVLDKEGSLASKATTQSVPEAWGGWHDAGDWNPRRVTHMKASHQLMELMEMAPAYFKAQKWGLTDKVYAPDLLKECLFELDLFRRLQKPDGGVPHGIETDGDPVDGEVSWNQSMTNYVYAPDCWSSWFYAGVAARASRLIASSDPALSKEYLTSAKRAFDWAERDRTRRLSDGSWAKLDWVVKDDRNFAALLLFAATGDKRYHDVFLQDAILKADIPNLFQYGTAVQSNAAFAYASLPANLGDAALKKSAVRGIERLAQSALSYANGNAFNLTTPDAGRPMFLGFFSVPDSIELARAHFLTGKPEYLAGVVASAQFSSGANPGNHTFTTGVGANPIRHPLHLDSRRTGQPAPEGFTTYGNNDWESFPDSFETWPLGAGVNEGCIPAAREWPLEERYFDIFLYVAQNEWTIDQTFGPNAYIWGYLAARK